MGIQVEKIGRHRRAQTGRQNQRSLHTRFQKIQLFHEVVRADGMRADIIG